jgi:hypothetical protein
MLDHLHRSHGLLEYLFESRLYALRQPVTLAE